jgi:Phage-related protein, tail component
MSCDTTQELRTIRLGGVLGKRFGRVHRLAVGSPAEALRALSVIKAGFREFMENSHKNGVAYRFLIGGEALERSELKESLHMTQHEPTFELVPVINGAKSSLGRILFGAALMAFAWWAMPAMGFWQSVRRALFLPLLFLVWACRWLWAAWRSYCHQPQKHQSQKKRIK